MCRRRFFTLPCRFWDTGVMETKMKSEIILHKMIVDIRRDDNHSELCSQDLTAMGCRMVVESGDNYKPAILNARTD